MTKLESRQVEDSIKNVAEVWMKNIAEEKSSTSSLYGLMAMLGSERMHIQVQSRQSAGAWMLGLLHWSLRFVPGSQSTAPPTYSYLPETSFLRATVAFLLEAGAPASGSEVTTQSCGQISAALRSLCGPGLSLPPLDWAGLLSPLMRLGYSEEVRILCLQVAALRMCESPSAASFVSSWLTPPLFSSLSMSSQAALHCWLPQVIKSVTPATLKIYLERSCSPAFTDLSILFSQAMAAGSSHGRKDQAVASSECYSKVNAESKENHIAQYERSLHHVVMSILAGLRDALAVDDPPHSVTMLLYEAVGRFYQLLPLGATEKFTNRYVALLQALAKCLALVPDDVLDSILVSDFIDATTQLKGSFIRSHLVASGQQPIAFLNLMIDAAFNVPGWNHSLAICLLATCLASLPRVDSADQDNCLQWLTELLGHTSSIATGAWPLAESGPPKDEVIHHLISVVTAVFLVFTSLDHDDLTIFGLDFKLFMKTDKEQSEVEVTLKNSKSQEKLYHILPQFIMQLKDISNCLPLSVLPLVLKKWDQVLAKVIDWLLTIGNQDHTDNLDKSDVYASLLWMVTGKGTEHSFLNCRHT
ncbi:focadhesin [Elysia marginata]|uniref:Focadhesin n=1 Tax=Elysia marginata TaxID=1093978 RepID=A0AAV4GP59_9GAST|nr:focadhesin [Elysia marginata]